MKTKLAFTNEILLNNETNINFLIQIRMLFYVTYFTILYEHKMKYLLIKVDGDYYTSNSLSIEIITMPKVNGNYLMPVNQFNMAYTAFNNIKYLIKNGIIDNNNSDILLNLAKLKRYNDNLSEI